MIYQPVSVDVQFSHNTINSQAFRPEEILKVKNERQRILVDRSNRILIDSKPIRKLSRNFFRFRHTRFILDRYVIKLLT